MSAKSSDYADPFINYKNYLQRRFVKFEKVCRDENLTKLFNELNNRRQSTIPSSDNLGSLSSKIILKDSCFYSSVESAELNYQITNKKEKLFLLYGLYHNYCWRIFDQLYNPMVEVSDGDCCAGGSQFSQDPLMIKCKDLIKEQKKQVTKTLLNCN